MPVSKNTFWTISFRFLASLIALVATAICLVTPYAFMIWLYAFIDWNNIPRFSFDISPVSKTSKPNLKGILTRFNLLNFVAPPSTGITSEINNLQAFVPISIAASFTI